MSEQQTDTGKLKETHVTQPDRRHHPVLVGKHLKDTSYGRTMVRVQKHLSPPLRLFSKFTHSAMLDTPSEYIAKTIGRPSGMLGGGVFALVGTLLLFWTVDTYGYEYNYLAVAILFAAGTVFGLFIEGIIKLLKR